MSWPNIVEHAYESKAAKEAELEPEVEPEVETVAPVQAGLGPIVWLGLGLLLLVAFTGRRK